MLTVLENGVREISGEVRNSLDFHRSQDGGGEVAHVVLSGAAQDIPGFAEALQLSLGVEVRPAILSVAHDAADGRLAAPARGRDRPCRLGGSAMRAVNLIPRDQRSGGSVGAGRSGGAAYAVLAVLAGFAVLAFALRQSHPHHLLRPVEGGALTAQAQQDKAAAEALARTRASSRCASSVKRP